MGDVVTIELSGAWLEYTRRLQAHCQRVVGDEMSIELAVKIAIWEMVWCLEREGSARSPTHKAAARAKAKQR